MKYMVLVGFLGALLTNLQAESPTAKEGGDAQGATAPSSTPAAADAWAKIDSGINSFQNSGDNDEAKARKQATELLAETHDFAAKFPSDPHAANATILWTQLASLMSENHWAGAPTEAEVDQALDRLIADKSLPMAERGKLRVGQLSRAIQTAADATGDSTALWKVVEEKFTSLQKDYGADFSLDGETPIIAVLRMNEISYMSSGADTAFARETLQKLTNDPQPQIAQTATMGLDRLRLLGELRKKPLELKYTAVDGREVDVAKLRGKVVLIDFWATWCGPCVAKMPEVIATYKKYHDQGLEIVGVSLDQDKNTMLSFTRRNGMAWPQYFDGQRFDNKISRSFDIDMIPAMWLADKNGMLASTNAGDDLASKVEALLKAPAKGPVPVALDRN